MSLNPRFFLDDLEIDEPIGWDSFVISITRDESLHGIGFEASVSALEFYGIAMEYIDCVKASQGLKSNIIFKAEENCGDVNTYETILQGRLNMGKYTKKCGVRCSVSLPVETESCEATFHNKYDQKVDADKNSSQNGLIALPSYPQLGITIDIPTKNIDYKSVGTVDLLGDTEGVVFSTPGGGSEAYALVRPEYVEEDTNIKDTHLTGSTNVGYSGPHGIFFPISSQVLFNEDNAKCFSEAIVVTGRLKGRVTMPGVSNLDLYSVRLDGELDGSWPINDPNQPIEQTTLGIGINTDITGPFEFDVTMTPYNWFPKNNGADGIYFYLALHQNPGANFNGQVVFDTESFINFTTLKACPATTAQVYMVHELLSRVVENVTDYCMRAKSSYYGRTDSQPFLFEEDGCGSLRVLTSGLKVRNALNPTFFISPKELIEGLQHIDNIGIGFEPDTTIPGRFVARVEDLDFFYQDFEVFQCLGIAEADFAVEEERDFSIIKIGYKRWETLANFGLDEINSNREYHLNIQTLNNTIDLTCSLIGGEYALEVTREQSFVDTNSADTTYDNENFIVCVRRKTYNTFEVEQDGITNPQNIFNPSTVTNYRISPLRNLMRWYRSLINAYPVINDSQNKLYFSSGTGNLLASGQLADGYGYGQAFCKNEGIDIKENMNLFITAFNDVARYTPLWENESIKFEYPMSVADYNQIKSKRYGYVTYQCGNGNLSKGWIKDIQYTPAKGSAVITLRQKWDPQPCDIHEFDPVPPVPPPPPPPVLALRLIWDDIANVPVADPTSLSDWATFLGPFSNVDATSIVVVGNEVQFFGSINFKFWNNLSGNTHLVQILDDAGSVKTLNSSNFLGCSALTTISFPAIDNVLGLGTDMTDAIFRDCISLSSVNLPTAKIISNQAFYGCLALLNITLPVATELLGSFPECNNLVSITANNVTIISDSCFANCFALTTINLPNLTTIITGGIFGGCSSLSSVSFPLLTNIGPFDFTFDFALTNLYLPSVTNMGGTTGDDGVFLPISGNTITLTIPTATATDGDVVYLQANNTVTLILV